MSLYLSISLFVSLSLLCPLSLLPLSSFLSLYVFFCLSPSQSVSVSLCLSMSLFVSLALFIFPSLTPLSLFLSLPLSLISLSFLSICLYFSPLSPSSPFSISFSLSLSPSLFLCASLFSRSYPKGKSVEMALFWRCFVSAPVMSQKRNVKCNRPRPHSFVVKGRLRQSACSSESFERFYVN